jgi:hypothetical protein
MVTASALVLRSGPVGAHILVRRYVAALVLTAAGMTASAIVASVAAATVAFAATGYANSLLLVSETQLIQLRVANAVQGRLFGTKTAIEGACFLFGLVGAGVLVDGVGVRFTLAAGAAICGVCALGGIVALRIRASRGNEAAGPVAEPRPRRGRSGGGAAPGAKASAPQRS